MQYNNTKEQWMSQPFDEDPQTTGGGGSQPYDDERGGQGAGGSQPFDDR